LSVLVVRSVGRRQVSDRMKPPVSGATTEREANAGCSLRVEVRRNVREFTLSEPLPRSSGLSCVWGVIARGKVKVPLNY